MGICSEHGKPVVYQEAGYFSHPLQTLYRPDPDDTEDRGWCEECKVEMTDQARRQDGCMSFLPIQDPDIEDEWADGTDLIMTPIGGVVDVLVCKCGRLQRDRARGKAKV